MNELLALAIRGHGGLARWQQLSRFRAKASITGAMWGLQGRPGLLDDIVVDGETRDQRLIISPFPVPGWYTTWEPHRQTIETAAGIATAERRDPAASFGGLIHQSQWDDFQVAYFAGEATWNCLTAPFVLARSDFVTEEIESWPEARKRRRGYVVAAFMVGLDDEIMVAASNGVTARMPVRQCSA